jgi:uncharacterized protein (TIGR03437 family)
LKPLYNPDGVAFARPLAHSIRMLPSISRSPFVYLLVALNSYVCLGQGVPSSTLFIEFENNVQYNQDTSDYSKFATDPNVTTTLASRNFQSNVVIADIVAVNGQPTKGLFFRERRTINLTPNPASGQGIADVTRTYSGFETAFEILQQDGTPIGSIFLSGFGGGSPTPPGAPLVQNLSNLAIVGGTGAFLGARGQGGEAALPGNTGARQASVTEDPSKRRINGGGKQRWVLQLIPMLRPEISVTSTGPAVTHSSDFSLVSGSKPARAGEVLSLFATGLGPTRPRIDPGQPFPASPLALVNSPVDVTVNGKSAEVLGAVGYPGAVDGYQVNFRVPADIAKGSAAIQVSAAWIAGGPVSIQVQ